MAKRTLVLVLRHPGNARLDCSPPLAWHNPVRSRSRRALGSQTGRTNRVSGIDGGVDLSALTVPAALHFTHFATAAPLGGSRLDRRADNPCDSIGRRHRRSRLAFPPPTLARTRDYRADRCNCRLGKCHSTCADRAGASAVADPRRLAKASYLAACNGYRASCRRALTGRVGMVDRDAHCAVKARCPGARVLGNTGRRESQLNRLRGLPLAWLLALLPTQSDRAHHQHLARLPSQCLGNGLELRRNFVRPGGIGASFLGRTAFRGTASSDRVRARRRCSPD